jgi:hypothetical protein
VMEEGLSHHAGNADYHFGKAYYLYMLGRPAEGNETMLKAMEIDYDGHKRLMTTFPEANNHPEITQLICSYKEKCLKHDPDQPPLPA